MGFRLDLKWGFPVHSHFLTNSPSRLPSSVRGKPLTEEGVVLLKDSPKAYTSFAASQTLENDYSETDELKINIGKRSDGSLHTMIGETQAGTGEYKSFLCTSPQACNSSYRFDLLMENLDVLEETLVDSDVLRLERDILLQLRRLGALNLFNTFLSRTLKSSVFEPSDVSINGGECNSCKSVDGQNGQIVVCSRKKKERRKRRERASESCTKLPEELPIGTMKRGFKMPVVSSAVGASNSRKRRLTIARSEAEMSKGVKVVAHLERIRTRLEEETGRIASLSCWAEAAGVNEKVLQQHLHFGWYCEDELLRSTRPLVLYLARNYRGTRIAHEDLIQAGILGVLEGAERFDHTRGYRFSTYVQYWIRKSMSKMVAQHSRGIQIPCTLSRAINQIQKARKVLTTSHGKHPEDDEIAKFTGLSLAKIRSADKCLRVVCSIDQKIGDCHGAKYLELLPDMSVKSPEELVLRQHMKTYVHHLLKGLDSRERQVMILRYGLKGFQPKSLEEIGRLFHVSKEWIRKLEKKAMTKLRDKETCRNLSYFLDL